MVKQASINHIGGNGKKLKATEPEKLGDFYAKGDE